MPRIVQRKTPKFILTKPSADHHLPQNVLKQQHAKCDSLPRTVFDHRSLLGSWDPGLSTAATLNARRHAVLAVVSLRLRAVTVCSKGQFSRYMKVFRSSLGNAVQSHLCLLFVGCFHVFRRLCLSTPLSYFLWVVSPPVVVDVRSPTPFFHFNLLYFPSSCSSFYFFGPACLVRVLSFF